MVDTPAHDEPLTTPRSFAEVDGAARDLDLGGLRQLGRSLRAQAPRSALASWQPPESRPDPVEWVRQTNAMRLPHLTPIRVGRMAADPFAFLRGAAGLMAADICPAPTSAIPVQACGDAHLMNFGVFGTTERSLVFDLNDFDETHPGAWEWDLQRLAASVTVAGRVHGFGESVAGDATRAMAESYQRRIAEIATMSSLERRYLRIDVDDVLANLRSSDASARPLRETERIVRKARARDSRQAFSKWTEVRDGRRVIVADPPLLQPLEPSEFREQTLSLYDTYRKTLPNHVVQLLNDYRFVDIALKVVGVGSVGTRALMVLMAGRADLDPLFLQIKEANHSVLAPYFPTADSMSQGRRVVEGQRLMQAAGDMFLGWAATDEREFYVRQLRDMKGSADLTRFLPPGFIAYATSCGTALALAHGRSQQPALISGYLGKGSTFAESLVAFARTYADQTERDHAALAAAVDNGGIEAVRGI